jgi:asparagine synthase (glutamine-hydrolysing)
MAAIAGIFGKKASPETVHRMLEAQSHRGPDHEHIEQGRNFVTGCRELNLGTQKSQAYAGGDKESIVFDGSIFNKDTSWRTDAEIVASRYETFGTDCFTYFEGSYAMAVVNDDDVVLVRDPVGTRPLFYAEDEEGLYFGSELKALSTIKPDIPKYMVIPGSGFSYSTKPISIELTPQEIPDRLSPSRARKKFRTLLSHAVHDRLMDQCVGGVALSTDSNSLAVAGCGLRLNPSLKLFSIGFDDSPVLEYIQGLANHLGAAGQLYCYRITDTKLKKAVEAAVWHCESFDEQTIVSGMCAMFMAHLAKRYTNCCLCADGAERIFSFEHPSVRQQRASRGALGSMRYLDGGWMAGSVEYRTPFLDRRCIEFGTTLSPHIKEKKYGRGVTGFLHSSFEDIFPSHYTPPDFPSPYESVRHRLHHFARQQISESEFSATTSRGVPLQSRTECWLYRIFKNIFPDPHAEKIATVGAGPRTLC